jgi:hypothetical protein
MNMPGGHEIEWLYDEHAQPLYAFLLNFTRDFAFFIFYLCPLVSICGSIIR